MKLITLLAIVLFSMIAHAHPGHGIEGVWHQLSHALEIIVVVGALIGLVRIVQRKKMRK